jgi:3-deoxy-D-manno-octulosonic-acid transferase
MVWVAGSTHEGEEQLVLDAHRQVRRRFADAFLVLVPRHPNRFDSVRDLLTRRGERAAYRSTGAPVAPSDNVMLGDTMGELMMFYAAADVAFVAGSLVPIGGHNLLEPASLGLPTLTGPHNFNSEEIAQLLLHAGATRIVTDSVQLGQEVTSLFADVDRRAAMGSAGRTVLDANRGALDRLLALIEPLVR